MTEPNKWEQCGRLANALRKLDDRHAARVAKLEQRHAAETAALYEQYPAEVVAMVRAEEKSDGE